MASILILEDGTGKADANSYVSAEDARAYAALRGLTLPAVGSAVDPVESALVLASDYLESLRWIGVKATMTQALKWPRVFTSPVDGYAYACDFQLGDSIDPSYLIVPAKLKVAQSQLVVEQLVNSIVLQPSTVGGTQFITREKVDVIETSYSERYGTLSTPTMPKVDALINYYVVLGSGIGNLRVVRA